MLRRPFALFLLAALTGAAALHPARAQQGSASAQAQPVPDRKALLQKARDSYYSLRREGLESFRCNVTPDWGRLLQKERESDPEAAANAIRTLQQLRFIVTLGGDDAVTMTHNELKGQSKQMADALAQIYDGMEQMATGFFDTWKLFVLNTPFPAVNSDYRFDAMGAAYRLSYREAKTDVVTMLDKALAITDVRVNAPEFRSSIQPGFAATAKGYLLVSYNADYRSSKPEETTQLKARIANSPVAGMQLVRQLHLEGLYGGDRFAVDLAFSNCTVTKTARVAELVDPRDPGAPAFVAAGAVHLQGSAMGLATAAH